MGLTTATNQQRLLQLEGENESLRREIGLLRAENKAARASAERLELAQRATGVGIFDWDMDGDVAYLSPEWLRVYGLPEDTGTLRREDWLRLVHPDDRHAVGARALEAAQAGKLYEDEFRVVWPDGSVRWIRTRGKTVLNKNGRANRFVGTAVDVTRVKQTESALRESEARYRTLFETMSEGFSLDEVLFDETGQPYDLRYLAVNPAFERQTGLKAADIIGRTTLELFPEAERIWFERYGRVAVSGEPASFDAWFGPLDRCFEVRAFRTELGRVAILFFDITERRRAEQAVRESDERMRLATEATGVGIWEWNVITDKIRWDAQMFQIYGVAATADGIVPYSTWSSSVLAEDLPEQERVLRDTVCRLGHSSREFRIRRPGESTCRCIHAVETVRTNDQGKAEWVVGTNVDVTARKQADQALRQREAELRSIAANLAKAKEAAENASTAKDQFLAVLSHELRTPLAPVRMTLSMWERQKHLLPPTLHEDLAMIRRNVDLECRLIDDMLDVNRIAHGKLDLQLAPVDVHEVLRHALRIVEDDAGAKQIVVSCDCGASHSQVVADAARLQQVLWNLLKNAVKFTPPGGKVAARTCNSPDGSVCVEVSDTGAGIEPDVMKRIFDAFEQGGSPDARQFGGLGLGLAISKALVEMHGGTLDARSQGKDRGATFTLKLKAAPPPEADLDDPHIAAGVGLSAERRGQLLRILLVDDHKDTAHIMKRLLGSFGYQVHTAGSVAEALAAAHAQCFDLIISDIGLPDGTGYELMRQILAHRPIKGIALTGYGMEEDIRKGVDAGFDAHLTKPINIEQLELTIRRVMGQKADHASSAKGKPPALPRHASDSNLSFHDPDR